MLWLQHFYSPLEKGKPLELDYQGENRGAFSEEIWKIKRAMEKEAPWQIQQVFTGELFRARALASRGSDSKPSRAVFPAACLSAPPSTTGLLSGFNELINVVNWEPYS